MRTCDHQVLAEAYPASVLFAIVVTADLYWLDAVGGRGALAVGCFAGDKLHHKRKQLRDRQIQQQTETY